MTTQVNEENLLKAGYTKTRSEWDVSKNRTHFQKAIRDIDNRKLFYLNVYQYHVCKYIATEKFIAEVQFNNGKEETFDLNLLDLKSIERVEDFFINAFFAFDCKYED